MQRPIEARLGAIKPSLAVLPFANLSADPEQEYFADGMVEDITTALSRISGLFVIARNSSFTYKGRAIDVRQVGRELGVRYVLEGSVRKAGGRVRITCQLVNAQSGAHVWADRFDGALDDIFALQDRVTESVAGALEPTLREAEIERALNKPTESLDAYDLYLRAHYHYDQFTRDDFEEALQLLRQAIALDPRFALAKALAAWCIAHGVVKSFYRREDAIVAEGIVLARSALAAARDDPTTLRFAGHAIAYIGLDRDAGRAALDRAMAVNPNSAQVLMSSGWLRLFVADYATARDEFLRALRLSPFGPESRFALSGLCLALTPLGEFEEALRVARRAIAFKRGAPEGLAPMIGPLAGLGRMEEARDAARLFVESEPGYTLAVARSQLAPFVDCEQRIALQRSVGIPEG